MSFLPSPPSLIPGLLVATSLLAGGCRKEAADPLPKATQTGANTFGCRLNGEPWLPNGYHRMSGEVVKVSASYETTGACAGCFCVGAFRRERVYDDIELVVNKLDHVGTYPLNTTNHWSQPWIAGGRYRPLQPSSTDYLTDSLRTGTLTITRLDTVARIISGTFTFSAHQTGGTQVASVTDGRFDVSYSE